jgi:hypothetical protein
LAKDPKLTDVNRGKQKIAPLQIPPGLDVTRDISGALDATAADPFALSENRLRFPDDALARDFFLLRLTDDEATPPVLQPSCPQPSQLANR